MFSKPELHKKLFDYEVKFEELRYRLNKESEQNSILKYELMKLQSKYEKMEEEMRRLQTDMRALKYPQTPIRDNIPSRTNGDGYYTSSCTNCSHHV